MDLTNDTNTFVILVTKKIEFFLKSNQIIMNLNIVLLSRFEGEGEGEGG
jgi:hypothetical protein